MDLDRLEELYEKSTSGKWSWEDNPPTVYAGREENLHGLNLFGRSDR